MSATRPEPTWPGGSAPRIGLGCMRLSTDADRDEQRALATIAAAVDAGTTVFDTARAYGHGEHDLGHNERLLARALRLCGGDGAARVVTKGGMSRPGGAWVPDGRAKAIRSDCEASLVALDGLPIDLYLVHAPDPRTPWRTTVRALARLVDDGLVPRIGVANVNRSQLDEAMTHAPITAVQVALGPLDDRALRGGVVERCVEAGIAVIAHSPLGGPRRGNALARRPGLVEVAQEHDATPADVALAWLLDLSPAVVAIPGARRPETARAAARAARLTLRDEDRAVLAGALGTLEATRPGRPRGTAGAEVVLVMGIPGAGKSRVAERYVERGYERLNRDERGGTLRDLAEALDRGLAGGARRVVLDNTYLTRASRSYVIEVAARQGAHVECLWLDVPLAQAQVNLVERLLERLGSLPEPEELRALARREPEVLAPTSQMRALRELEPPGEDEGFARVRRVRFERRPGPERTRAGVFVACAALNEPTWRDALDRAGEGDLLLFDWRPEGHAEDLAADAERLAAALGAPVETAVCPHGGGPPVCWCRPPLPGLVLSFARAHRVDPTRSTVVGTSAAHRTLADSLGARYVAPT